LLRLSRKLLLRIEVLRLWVSDWVGRRHALDRNLRAAPDRAQRLTLGSLDVGWVGAAAAFEVEVLANRVVK
jgi:hypothetical protein